MKIANCDLDKELLVVAEIGNNHEGDFPTAEELVRKAAACGAGAVKFQTFRTKYFVSSKDKARYDRLSSFELSYDEFEKLQRLANSLGLLFISTPLDMESAGFLEGIVDCYKIASGDSNFYPLIERVCKTRLPIILSSGLSDLAQITKSVQFIRGKWCAFGVTQDLAVLHCVSSYPVPVEQANVAAVKQLAEKLDCVVGYSDHTLGTLACIIAVVMGARIIEKHFTLDKHYSEFRDHQLSADPPELSRLVQQLSEVNTLLGSGEKVLQKDEAKAEQFIRRSIVAAVELPAGHRLTFADLTWTRPAIGLPPGDEEKILGRRLRRPLSFGEPVLPQDLE